jgi:hypothetical protein
MASVMIACGVLVRRTPRGKVLGAVINRYYRILDGVLRL